MAALLLGGSAAASLGVTFKTKDAALAEAFPGAEIVRRVETLSDAQAQAAERLGGEKLPSRLVYIYEGRRDGRLVGTAYFDVHQVRTLPETLLAVVNPDGSLRDITVLAFNEPQEYLAAPRWLDQFRGEVLDDDLHLRRGVDGITGATLTARAVTKAARRTLAVHQVLHPARP